MPPCRGMVGRNDAYIQQYLRKGTAEQLKERERRALARYFKIPGVCSAVCPRTNSANSESWSRCFERRCAPRPGQAH